MHFTSSFEKWTLIQNVHFSEARESFIENYSVNHPTEQRINFEQFCAIASETVLRPANNGVNCESEIPSIWRIKCTRALNLVRSVFAHPLSQFLGTSNLKRRPRIFFSNFISHSVSTPIVFLSLCNFDCLSFKEHDVSNITLFALSPLIFRDFWGLKFVNPEFPVQNFRTLLHWFFVFALVTFTKICRWRVFDGRVMKLEFFQTGAIPSFRTLTKEICTSVPVARINFGASRVRIN